MLMQSVNLLSSFYWAVSVFVVAQYEDTLLNHPFVCVPNSDCSGGFGGLSRRWGRRRRRWWGRAVPQEATPPELIRLTPLFGSGGRTQLLLSSLLWSSQWFSACLCHLFVPRWRQETVERSTHSAPPHPCSPFFHSWREMESFSFGHLFLQHLFLLYLLLETPHSAVFLLRRNSLSPL